MSLIIMLLCSHAELDVSPAFFLGDRGENLP